MRVLIVADDPSLQRVASWVLQEEGFDVRVVDSLDAARAVIETRPDVVILDTSKPQAEQADAIWRLRQALPDVAVLELTRSGSDEGGTGADGYLAKPYDGDQLLDRLREAARAARSKRARPASDETPS
jgi:DNA-binding response OmpR family regulator